MKYIHSALLSLCLILLSHLDAKQHEHKTERYKIDGINTIIYGEEETVIITDSDVQRPGIDGQIRTLEDLILENLIYLDAKHMGAIPSQEDLQRHWEEVKLQNNLSEEDMRNIASQAGYTIVEAKTHLGKMSAINQMMDFKVRSGLFIPKREVERHYNEHPEVQQAEYCISRAIVPFSDLEPKEQQKKRLDQFAKTGKGTVRIAWSEPFWLLHDDVAPEKHFIYTMHPGHISCPQETIQGFELIKLNDKKLERLIPLEERYKEIENELKMPKYEQLFEKYKKELSDKTTIVTY